MQNLSKYLRRQYMPICFCYNMISCIRANLFTIQNGISCYLGQDNKFHLQSFEILIMVQEFHTWIAKGHFPTNIICKILDARYWSSTLYQDNIYDYYKTYDAC